MLLNPKFETQVTLIAYFLKKLTNYFIIASYFCPKLLHSSFIYEAFRDIKVSFLHCLNPVNGHHPLLYLNNLHKTGIGTLLIDEGGNERFSKYVNLPWLSSRSLQFLSAKWILWWKSDPWCSHACQRHLWRTPLSSSLSTYVYHHHLWRTACSSHQVSWPPPQRSQSWN